MRKLYRKGFLSVSLFSANAPRMGVYYINTPRIHVRTETAYRKYPIKDKSRRIASSKAKETCNKDAEKVEEKPINSSLITFPTYIACYRLHIHFRWSAPEVCVHEDASILLTTLPSINHIITC